MNKFIKTAEDAKNIMTTEYRELVSDRWIATRRIIDKTVKWVLENPKYEYRDYYYEFNPTYDSGLYKLLTKLQLRQELGRINLPYKIYTKRAKVFAA
ncbi:MAG: hypothetical protein ACK5LJ_17735 [Paracoccus sp. (in: a-proteobacteria)]